MQPDLYLQSEVCSYERQRSARAGIRRCQSSMKLLDEKYYTCLRAKMSRWTIVRLIVVHGQNDSLLGVLSRATTLPR